MIKWLKSCIIWLIGWLVLLPSFSSAYNMVWSNMLEATAPDTAVVGNYVYVFSNNWNFATDNYWQFIYRHNNCAWYSCDYVYGWSNWKLYFAWLFGWSIQTQWYISSVCVSSSWANCTNFDEYTADSFYWSDLNITKVLIWLPDWNSLTSASSSAYPLRLCFFDSLSSSYYCVQNNIFNSWYPATSISNLNWSLNFSSLQWIKDYSWWSSPFKSTYKIPDYWFNEDDDFTNWQIVEGYNHMWLTDEFCYWGFALNNIFQNWQVPSQFTWYRRGGGASIFDIWNIYSWAYNNDYVSFIRTFYVAYNSDNYSEFYGYPKALYGFINQWASVSSQWLWFIEATAPQFTLIDVWQYCDIRFHKNPNDQYTWNRRDPKRNYYRSWQVNLWGYFNFSWNNNYFSWNLSWFNSPKDFFASLNAIFQNWLNWLSSEHDPIIPSYILIFMFAIILVRMLSH